MVIENHPRLEDGSPFPTLFWLTCPILAKRISTIEGSGDMQTINTALQADKSLRTRLSFALDRQRARRDSHEVIEDSGSPPGGGPERVKCLHAHAAHQLADAPNPIGALTVAATGWPDCRQPCYSMGEPQ